MHKGTSRNETPRRLCAGAKDARTAEAPKDLLGQSSRKGVVGPKNCSSRPRHRTLRRAYGQLPSPLLSAASPAPGHSVWSRRRTGGARHVGGAGGVGRAGRVRLLAPVAAGAVRCARNKVVPGRRRGLVVAMVGPPERERLQRPRPGPCGPGQSHTRTHDQARISTRGSFSAERGTPRAPPGPRPLRTRFAKAKERLAAPRCRRIQRRRRSGRQERCAGHERCQRFGFP